MKSGTYPWKDWVGLLARLVLGGVLLVAGLLKLGNLEGNVLAVRAYRILPYDLAKVVGYGLPVLEIVLGLLLIAGLFTRLAGAVSAAVMLAFTVGIAQAWARGFAIDCGCFGGGGAIAVEEALKAYPWEIARDIALLALGIWLAIRPRSPLAADSWLFRPVAIPDLSEIDDHAESEFS